MQVRSLITVAAAALLSVAAVGASAQEIDRSETLAARNIAAQQRDAAARSRLAVVAEVRNLQSQHELQKVGELSGAPEVGPAPAVVARGLSRAEVRADLAQWRSAHPLVVGERG